jgi:hypothetical protein
MWPPNTPPHDELKMPNNPARQNTVQRPAAPLPMKTSTMIVFAGFKGMGDLINAAPAIAETARRENDVLVLISPGLSQLAALLDFGEAHQRVRFSSLPTIGTLYQFVLDMQKYRPAVIWISPHSPVIAASRKMLPLIWLLRKSIWGGSVLAAAESEPFSWLADRRISVDRSLPYVEREWLGIAAALNWQEPYQISHPKFIDELGHPGTKLYDLIIHPGASTKNKQWPPAACAKLVKRVQGVLRVAILGLPSEIEAVQAFLPPSNNVTFISGSLRTAIMAMSQSRLALTMDSSSLHFARMLGVPAIVIFGPSDPKSIQARSDQVLPISATDLPCKPCQKKECRFSRIHCMEDVSPEQVEAAVISRLGSLNGFDPSIIQSLDKRE